MLGPLHGNSLSDAVQISGVVPLAVELRQPGQHTIRVNLRGYLLLVNVWSKSSDEDRSIPVRLDSAVTSSTHISPSTT